jgi:hypothetical protein
MPLPSGFGIPITTPDLLTLETRGLGTYTSELLYDPTGSFSAVTAVELLVYVNGVSGSSPTLDCSLESSSDDGSTWTAIPGSSITQLSAAGSAVANANVSSGASIRATSTVGGSSTPTVTYRVTALLIVPNDS